MPTIREMTPQDAAAVEEVEIKCFSVPWSRESFWREAAESNTLYLVAEEEGKIVGYIGAWILSGEGQVTNVAVHPSFRRRGIGEKLFAEFIACGIKRGMTAVTLEVRPSNKAAIALYEKFGLKSVGRRKGYYIDNGEDAEIMWNTKITETFGGIGRKNFEQ